MALILKNLTIVTQNDTRDVVTGDIRIEGRNITAIGEVAVADEDEILDLSDRIALPGLVQAHIHLCQTLFRNRADDMELLDWLRLRIWPFEAAHNEESLYASSRLGIAELLSGGTTTILDMGTVRHTDAIFRAAEELGIRAQIGKTIMDRPDPNIPRPLVETAVEALKESDALADRWHGKAQGRLQYAYAPRFAVTCTTDSMAGSAERAISLGTPLHTHASENTSEVELVRELTGMGNLEYLESVGVLKARPALAHCIHVSAADRARIKEADATVVHCPSSNLKLASGIAPIPSMLAEGIRVALGADGAPCNNNLDAFLEMRLAALIHKPGYGPQAMPAGVVLDLATRAGADALGKADEIGSLESGKRADITVLDLNRLHATGGDDVVSRIVYSARADDVEAVLVDGRLVKRDGQLLADADEIRAQALESFEALRRRMS